MALNERYSSILDKCTGSLTTWKNFINENGESLDKDIELAKLKVIAREYCIIDENHKISQGVIQSLEQTFTHPVKDYNIDEMFKEKLENQCVEDPLANEIWQQLFSNDISVQEVKPKKRKDNTQYEEVDDSLLCSSSFSAPLDPISKIVIRKPLRNKKCKHVYDNQTIYDYIRQSKSKAKCPYMGCKNNKLVVSDLQEDPVLEEKISQYLESQANEEVSDDESN